MNRNVHFVPDYNHEAQQYWQKIGEEELINALQLRRNEKTAKNVILFIGDGMGPNTVTATRIYKGGESSHLEFEKFPNVGLLKTYSVDRTVPDSACTATALFTGVKTNYEVSGVDGGVPLKNCQASLNKERRLSSIMAWAQEAGKDTGFVTTTRVTHATPSALYSHSADRKWECDAVMPQSAAQCKDIARQMVEDLPGRDLKVIMGGGRQCLTWNITNKTSDPIDTWACRRNDGRDLIKLWETDKIDRKVNYKIVSTTQDLLKLDYNKTEFLLGVFANSHIAYEDERDKSPGGMPSLKEMTVAAIKLLQKNTNGFVLMVEGGLIDYAHHRGLARRALEETVMFDETIAEAVKLTRRNYYDDNYSNDDGDTLIVVTSDHAHNLNINGNTQSRDDILGMSEQQKSIAMNSKIDGVPYTTLTYATGGPRNYQYETTPGGNIQRKDPTNSNTTSYTYNQQAGIVNDEATHGGVDVPVFATGPMSHLFHGLHEQSYVAHVVAYAAKMGRYKNRADVPGTCANAGFKRNGAGLSEAGRLLVAIVLSLYLHRP
ncbi:hypothetical protein RUM43_008104 [Polyplax serrata]|uniref:Alkaline phosphatase n=1 Tax=Polyplax serrata TaxID=468196 RepID=A0AAN8S8W3_POLSC